MIPIWEAAHIFRMKREGVLNAEVMIPADFCCVFISIKIILNIKMFYV